MIKHLLTAVFILTFISNSFCQRKIEPDAYDIAKAKKLKKKFDHKDDEVALEESIDYVTFDFDSREEKVIVHHQMITKGNSVICRFSFTRLSLWYRNP